MGERGYGLKSRATRRTREIVAYSPDFPRAKNQRALSEAGWDKGRRLPPHTLSLLARNTETLEHGPEWRFREQKHKSIFLFLLRASIYDVKVYQLSNRIKNRAAPPETAPNVAPFLPPMAAPIAVAMPAVAAIRRASFSQACCFPPPHNTIPAFICTSRKKFVLFAQHAGFRTAVAKIAIERWMRRWDPCGGASGLGDAKTALMKETNLLSNKRRPTGFGALMDLCMIAEEVDGELAILF
jgi:hypothetical protein